MTVVVPCDHFQAYKATMKISELQGPAFLRLAREATAALTDEKSDFKIGKAQILVEGNDCAVFFAGTIGVEVMKAVELLHKKGIFPTIINMHTIKPIDKECMIKYAKKFGKLMTIEEHLQAGGLGSAIAEVLAENYPTKMKMLAIYDRFGESGKPDVLLDAFGLSAKKICAQIEEFVKE